ncbi:MAG: lysylphosphatidylglycerol synthase transmembrane domain-containing protein [Blautia sp.]
MKKNKRMLFSFLLLLVMGLLLGFLLRDSWPEIQRQLKNAAKEYLLVMLLLGNAYFVLDGMVYYHFAVKGGAPITLLQAVAMAYMTVFFSITTFGAGTKPCQTWYLYKNGMELGKGIGILTVEYISHKMTVTLYACVAVVLQWRYLHQMFPSIQNYILMGFCVSIGIIFLLVWACLSDQPGRWVLKLCGRFWKKEGWRRRLSGLERQFVQLRSVGRIFFHWRSRWGKAVLLNACKLTCWYAMPWCAYVSVMHELPSVPFLHCILIGAIMQMLIGVIPSSGGIGSTEVVYLMLFGVLFGASGAGATAILYRFFSYYVPFVISIGIVARITQSER